MMRLPAPGRSRVVRRSVPWAIGLVSSVCLAAAVLGMGEVGIAGKDFKRELIARHILCLPLSAAHTGQPLWHAAGVLREQRGVGHIMVLVIAELDGLEAQSRTQPAAGAPLRSGSLALEAGRPRRGPLCSGGGVCQPLPIVPPPRAPRQRCPSALTP